MFAPTTQTESRTTTLADIIREETDDGRLLVRVLRDIAEGKTDDTKPHHRIAAVKELFRQRFNQMPDHSCGGDDENDSLTAANTAGEKLEKPSDDVPGSDQPSEIAVAAGSEIDHPTENTDSAVLEPEQSREEPRPADNNQGQTLENTDSSDPQPGQDDQEPGPTDLGPVRPLENPGPDEPRSRRAGRAQRRRKRNSTTPPVPHDNGTGNTQLAVDSVVAAGFR